MHARNGLHGDRQIVPEQWVRNTRAGDAAAREAFSRGDEEPHMPGGLYRNQWWMPRTGGPVQMALHGLLSAPFWLAAARNSSSDQRFVPPPQESASPERTSWMNSATCTDASTDVPPLGGRSGGPSRGPESRPWNYIDVMLTAGSAVVQGELALPTTFCPIWAGSRGEKSANSRTSTP
jgi:hypothetical protein